MNSSEQGPDLALECNALRDRVAWYEKYSKRLRAGELLPFQRRALEIEWAREDLDEIKKEIDQEIAEQARKGESK